MRLSSLVSLKIATCLFPNLVKLSWQSPPKHHFRFQSSLRFPISLVTPLSASHPGPHLSRLQSWSCLISVCLYPFLPLLAAELSWAPYMGRCLASGHATELSEPCRQQKVCLKSQKSLMWSGIFHLVHCCTVPASPLPVPIHQLDFLCVNALFNSGPTWLSH